MGRNIYQHDYDPNLHRVPLFMLCMLVTLVGIGVGGTCGWLAGTKLRWENWILNGLLFGLLSGWLAGVVWCRIMMSRILHSHRPHKDLTKAGARWGTIVGLLAAMIVFIWLFLNLMQGNPNIVFKWHFLTWWLTAELFGGLIGAGVGYLCGWAAYIAAKFALPLPPLDPKNHPQRPI